MIILRPLNFHEINTQSRLISSSITTAWRLLLSCHLHHREISPLLYNCSHPIQQIFARFLAAEQQRWIHRFQTLLPSVILRQEEDVPLLEEVLKECSSSALKIETFSVWANIPDSHQILRRLVKLDVSRARMEDFPVLNSICERYSITLKLRTDKFLYPAMLKQLAKLHFFPLIRSEDIVCLSTRGTFPKLRQLEIDRMAKLQTLENCSYVQAKLSYMGVDLPSEETLFLFNRIRKLCYNFRLCLIKMPYCLVKCLQNFPLEIRLGSSGDNAIIFAKSFEDHPTMGCHVQHGGDLAESKGLQPVEPWLDIYWQSYSNS